MSLRQWMEVTDMGGRGNSASRSTTTPSNPQERLIGKHVDEFAGVKSSDVESLLGISNLTQSQKNTLAQMLRSSAENDYSYGEKKSPYVIDQFKITKIGEEFSKSGTGDISVLMTTYGDSGRPNIDWMDHRTRLFIIGKKGGAYTYNDKRKKVQVSNFDVRYGKLD